MPLYFLLLQLQMYYSSLKPYFITGISHAVLKTGKFKKRLNVIADYSADGVQYFHNLTSHFMKKMILCLLILCMGGIAGAETKWELKKDQEGIKVYTGNVPNTNIKAVKAVFVLDATLSQLTALLLDTKAHEQWVYSTKTSYLVKNLGTGRQMYYSEVAMPWPLANRDVVADMVISQQPATKVMSVSVNAAQNGVPLDKNKVRVPLSKVNWTVTPIAHNKLSVEYVAQADPGGDIPAWLVNSFCIKGPFETFKKLRELVSSAAYVNAQFDFITN